MVGLRGGNDSLNNSIEKFIQTISALGSAGVGFGRDSFGKNQ